MTAEEKFSRLKKNLNRMKRVLIAFSGGVDSTFLLKAATVSNMKDILAVTGISASVPKDELSFAKEITASMEIQHVLVNTDELSNKKYIDNPPDRCYYCKKELFGKLKDIASRQDFQYIIDGTNADDAQDWRPGSKAAREEGVISPLLDVGMTKAEIRKISKHLNLPTWNKPAAPCLSSRFPYGQKISSESLDKVHQAETFIKTFGIKELRVRYHANVARIEINQEDFSLILSSKIRNEIINYLKSLGFQHITLDLKGFRSGSANETLINHELDSL